MRCLYITGRAAILPRMTPALISAIPRIAADKIFQKVPKTSLAGADHVSGYSLCPIVANTFR